MVFMMWITKKFGGVISGLFWGNMKKPAWTVPYFAGGMYREVEEKTDEEDGTHKILTKFILSPLVKCIQNNVFL
jgi:hypothetical protein